MRALWYSYWLSISLDSEVSGLDRSSIVSTSSRVMWDGNSRMVPYQGSSFLLSARGILILTFYKVINLIGEK